MDPTLAWLLDPEDPAVRAAALVDLLGMPQGDPSVMEARREMGERGSVARLLQDARVDVPDLYRPKYGAAFHRLVALAEMGAGIEDPRAARLLDACLDRFFEDWTDQEVCLTGNLARAACKMGRADDPRVVRAWEWLIASQLDDGGWHCWPDGSQRGTLDAWEALGAFAAVPERDRTPAMRAAIERGVAFFLERRLGVDDAYLPWRRIHFPRHYYYDILVGLDVVTALGAAGDARLRPALDWLASQRGAEGGWHAQAQHPDVGEGADYTLRDAAQVKPLVVADADKWATLAALRVLRRVAEG